MHERTPRNPAWGLLYVVTGGMLGVLGIVEAFVPPGPLRRTLELVIVIVAFAAMAVCVRVNRRALEVAGEPVWMWSPPPRASSTLTPRRPPYRVGRVARARKLDEPSLRALVERHVEGRLALDRALDETRGDGR